jgi:hypothetical protein
MGGTGPCRRRFTLSGNPLSCPTILRPANHTLSMAGRILAAIAAITTLEGTILARLILVSNRVSIPRTGGAGSVRREFLPRRLGFTPLVEKGRQRAVEERILTRYSDRTNSLPALVEPMCSSYQSALKLLIARP